MKAFPHLLVFASGLGIRGSGKKRGQRAAVFFVFLCLLLASLKQGAPQMYKESVLVSVVENSVSMGEYHFEVRKKYIMVKGIQ